ncbi:hypothetical protein T484DRAFT_1789099 [Baffinella frigidus]|nr:hypothetical protein T484DRAFT_1789099 [Cryptophyta sp. CCMP2293]
MTEATATWGCVFNEQEMEDDTSDTTSQSLKSRSPEIQSSNGDETEATDASSETRKRPHARLTKEQAAVIYVLRPWQKDSPYPKHVAAGNSQLLAKWFGVTPKAVRDVWNRRTWAHATGKHVPASVLDSLPILQQLEKARSDVVVRRPGRPIGSKDTTPRRRGATKVPGNLALDKRANKTAIQTGMSREAVHAAMAEHILSSERMEERGGSQSEPPADSDGTSPSPPSQSEPSPTLYYLNGSSQSPPSEASGGTASSASMAASAHAQQLAAAAWNMCAHREVPSPDGQDRERLGSSHAGPATMYWDLPSPGGDLPSPGGDDRARDGSPERNFPCLLSATDVAAQLSHVYQRQRQQHQRQQHQPQQRGDTAPCAKSLQSSYTGLYPQSTFLPSSPLYPDVGWNATAGLALGIEAWRGGSHAAGATPVLSPTLGVGGSPGSGGVALPRWGGDAGAVAWRGGSPASPPQWELSPPHQASYMMLGEAAQREQWARGGVQMGAVGPGYSGGLEGGGQLGAYGQGFGAW